MRSANLEILKSFLGGYFHQDWDLEASDADKVIANYLASKPSTNNIEMIIVQIDQYLNDAGDDLNIEVGLLRDLGCYYLPSADGLTAHNWLRHVAHQLRNKSL
jgi:hypothetical protein